MVYAMTASTAEGARPRYEAPGWEHWPDHPLMSYQFRRALGETQEGGGAVSECLLAASKMRPGDKESWHREWLLIGDANNLRAQRAANQGFRATARNGWLRAANYFRHAEFWLDPLDPRRLATFEKIEACTKNFLAYLSPPGEVVEIPYIREKPLDGYFVRSPFGKGRQPVLICLGGLDSFKDEMWFMQARGAIERGLSVLMVDGPGQGSALRRYGLTARADYEVPISACVDYLETRADVDPERIALCGSSLGGYYAARAASFEHRLAACISHGLLWIVDDMSERVMRHEAMHGHFNWVLGQGSIEESCAALSEYRLTGVIDAMRCPYLIVNGSHDIVGREDAFQAYDYANSVGIDVTLRLTTPDETGAEHCQHDNPTMGQEILLDWLTVKLGIEESE